MDLELITIGTELLLGFTIDTNAAEMGRALAQVGARVVRRATVPDDPAAIRAAVAEALARTGRVITTGGLGPTNDDVTKRVVAELYGVPLDMDVAYLAALEVRWTSYGRTPPMPTANRTQAEVPRGATVLPNARGTAPGLWLDGPPGTVIMLPGVPHEMRGLMQEHVIPRLMGGSSAVIASRVLRTTGIAESALADKIGELEDQLSPVTLAYLPSLEGVDLRLTAWTLPAAEAASALARAVTLLQGALEHWCYGEEDTDITKVVLDQLAARGRTLAVAESCTGGLIGARLTEIPGSSAVFQGGVVAYANSVKTRDLDVPQTLLDQHGAVSEPVVVAMARGARRRFEVSAALAVTGIAGPDGGTPEKPVGTVWLAASVDDRERTALRRYLGPREEVRRRAAQAALDLLRQVLLED